MRTLHRLHQGPGHPPISVVLTKTVWPGEPEILTYLTLCRESLLTPDIKGGKTVLEMFVEPLFSNNTKHENVKRGYCCLSYNLINLYVTLLLK